MKKKNHIFVGIIIIFLLIVGFLIINNVINKEGEFKKITYNEIKKKLDNKEDFVLVVSRSTCSHCMTYKPKVSEIAKKEKIIIYYIDYDEEKNSEKLLNELNLDGSTPITLFIKNGKETSILNRLEGDLESEKVTERLKKTGFIK